MGCVVRFLEPSTSDHNGYNKKTSSTDTTSMFAHAQYKVTEKACLCLDGRFESVARHLLSSNSIRYFYKVNQHRQLNLKLSNLCTATLVIGKIVQGEKNWYRADAGSSVSLPS